MAASYGGALTRSTNWNTSSLTATSTGRTAGQLLVALFGHEPTSATINTLSGWALGGAVASASGSNDLRATAFTRECDTTETNTWTSTANLSPYTAQVIYFDKGAGEVWEVSTVAVADSTASGTTVSLNAGDMGIQTGDIILAAVYSTYAGNHYAPTLTVPGCTLSRTIVDYGNTSLGTDVGWLVDYWVVTAGSQTGDLTHTLTAASSGNAQAAATYVRVRSVVGIPEGSTSGTLTFTGSATGEMPAVVMEGSASGDVTVTGSSTGARASAGAATGQAEFTGSSVGSIDLSGSATGQVEYIVSAAGDREEFGYVENVISFPNQLGYFQWLPTSVVGVAPTNNSATGSFTIVGAEASGEHPPPNFGSAGGDLTYTATTFGKHQKRGSVYPGDAAPGEGLLTYTGVATGARPSATGTITFTGSAQGEMPSGSSVTGSYSLDGSASGTRTSEANAVGSHSYSGTSAGTRTSSGAASGGYVFSGSAQTSQTIGSVVGSYLYTGSAAGVRDSRGQVTGGVTFAGSGTGAKTSSGAVTGGVSVTVVVGVGRNDIRDVTIILKRGPYGYALDPNLQPRHALRVGHPQQHQIRIRSKRE